MNRTTRNLEGAINAPTLERTGQAGICQVSASDMIAATVVADATAAARQG